jgi:ELWxxDGT repeat protein
MGFGRILLFLSAALFLALTGNAQKISFVYNLSNAVGPNYQVMESVEIGGKLYFSTWADSGTTLWVVDGGNVSQVYHWGYDPRDYALNKIYVYGNKLLFTGIDSAHGKELWISDGTLAGTALVKDLYTGPRSAFSDINGFTYNSNAQRYTSFVFLNGKAYFSAACDSGNASSVYETDGTIGGTRLIDIFPHLGHTYGPGRGIGLVNKRLLMGFATAPSVYAIYYTDSPFSMSNVLFPMLYSEDFFYWNNRVLFKIDSRNGLAITDGSPSNTTVLDSFISVASDFAFTTRDLYFFSVDGRLCSVNSSMTGINIIKNGFGGGFDKARKLSLERKRNNPSILNDKLYFISGRAVWTSDGTSVGTVKVKDYATNATLPFDPPYPTCLTTALGKLFYRGFDSTRVELFMSDGTEAGTTKISYPVANYVDSTFFAQIYPSPKGFQPYDDIMMGNGNSLFFTAAYTNGVGKALYRLDFSNGVANTMTEVGGKLIAYPNPGNGNSVSLAYPEGKYTMSCVMDAAGRVVFEQKLNARGKAIISLQHLASGTYFIQVGSEEGRLVTPFVLQR